MKSKVEGKFHMKNDNSPLKQRNVRSACVLLAMLALGHTPAIAQVAKVTTTMTGVQSLLMGVSVTIFTIAFIWGGCRIAFQHAKLMDVSNIFFGGIICGGASAFAAWLIN